MQLEEILQTFKERHPSKQLILLYKAGSHFFNLNGPNSDTDYRGLYIDLYQDSFESKQDKNYQVEYKTKVGDGKNSKDDTDFTLFSLSCFLNLLKSGDFNMMELLYTPSDKIIFKTPIYDELVSIRKNLLINDISAFLGFIKKEYKRYGVNIYHYKVQQDFVQFLKQWPTSDKMSDHWDEIIEYSKVPENFVKITTTKVNNNNVKVELPSLVVANRLHQNTVKISYVIEAIETVMSRYGHRQKSMAADGVEFKGLYHAMRLIYEANDLLDFGEFTFPFDHTRHDILKSIKNGTINQDKLFEMIDFEIEELNKRESLVKSNRKEVEDRLDKLIFSLRGKMSIGSVGVA